MTPWNPWKVTAVAMMLVMATALVTGLVVANWTGTSGTAETPGPQAKKKAVAQAPAPKPPRVPVTAPQAPPAPAVPAVPTQAVVDACNRTAAAQTGEKNKTVEVVKDAAVGAVVGAAVGAAGGAIAGGGSGAGKGAAIGGVLGAGGGTLYGLNENKKHDERYREAYANCMRSRGYAG